MSPAWKYFVIIVFLFLGITLGVLINTAPKIPSEISSRDFSVERELRHIRKIAQKPHPVGTAEHHLTKEYIIQELQSLGLNPQIQNSLSLRDGDKEIIIAANVDNIFARIKGTNNSRAILLMTHYDTVPFAPGANDDSAGVGAILEIIRALKTETPLLNDVIILITDGEEIGMMGAKAFIEEHPWASDIGMVLNLEARGSQGTSFMFETGPHNSWVVRAFRANVRFPSGNSITNALYQNMPNNTDFTLFKTAGIQGLNFAYIDGWHVYHSPIDDLDHLNKNTLNHHGASVLEILRYLGDVRLDKIPQKDAVYFSLLPSWLISYPIGLVWIFTALVTALFFLILLIGFRKKHLYLKGLVLGFLGLLLLGGAAVAAASPILAFIRSQFGIDYSVVSKYPDFRNIFLAAFFMLVLSFFFVIFGILRRWNRLTSLAAGAFIWWVIGLILISLYMPEGSFLFVWPLFFAIISWCCTCKVREPEKVSTWVAVLLGILMLPVLILWTTIFFAINTAFSLTNVFFIFPALVLGLFIPAMTVFRRKAIWGFSMFFLLFSIGIFAAGLLSLDAENRPRQQHVTCHIDTDLAQTTLGVSTMNDWTSQFINNPKEQKMLSWFPFPLRGKMMQTSISSISCIQSEIILVSDTKEEGKRRLELLVKNQGQAPLISLHIQSPQGLFSFQLDNKSVKIGKSDKLLIRAYAVPATGLTMVLEYNGLNPVEISAADLLYSMPDEVVIPAPPDHILYTPMTLVTKTIIF